MNQENWVKKDYQAGLSFIIDHEEEAASNTILATEVDYFGGGCMLRNLKN